MTLCTVAGTRLLHDLQLSLHVCQLCNICIMQLTQCWSLNQFCPHCGVLVSGRSRILATNVFTRESVSELTALVPARIRARRMLQQPDL